MSDRRTRLSILIAAGPLAFLVACGGDSSPTGANSNIGSGSTLVTGQVVGTVQSRPVVGARVEIGGVATNTDGSGSFQLGIGGQGVVPVRVSASRHVTRNTFLRTDGPTPVLDIIEEDTAWHLDFYRELCRDGGGGNDPRPLNPWTVEPRFYVDTRPESGTHRPISDESIETVVDAIRTEWCQV